MTPEEQQKLVNADNALIDYLKPEELELFAAADQAEADALQAQKILCQKVNAREPVDTAAEIFAGLDPEVREYARRASPEELRQAIEQAELLAKAYLVKARFYQIAEARGLTADGAKGNA